MRYEKININLNYSNEFYDALREIIKNMINNKDYEEFFDLLFYIQDNNIEYKKIFEYNDDIWKYLININDYKIKTKIIAFYFECYILEYFIVNKQYKTNLLFWFYDKSLNNKSIIYNYFLYDIINAKINNINKLNIIQPISFLKENYIFINNIFEYLLNSYFIFNI